LNFKFVALTCAVLLTGCVTTGPSISFNYYEKYPGGRHYHTGIDLDQPRGTPIVAAADGIVKRAQTNYAYAVNKGVTIDHGDDISTDYQHMDSVAVTEGQRVRRGDVIGTVGTTGGQGGFTSNIETGKPHLHFEVLKGMSTRNPNDYIVGCYDQQKTYKPLEMVWPTGC
jgi:murein DD-endopeptidase MepM/ murein hydrolase activator NlpD